MQITILTDNPKSWIMPHASRLKEALSDHDVKHVTSSSDIERGDVLFALSCERILSRNVRSLNKHNIVVHPSGLPRGRGWSPVAWQILEGSNSIPVSLFEAADDVDSGPIYLTDRIELCGLELNEEIKGIQGKVTVDLCLRFIDSINNLEPQEQVGEPTFYQKRTSASCEMDIDNTIRNQFNLLRTVDNERYPAFFVINGARYTLRITRDD